jgi:hypothetical protein
MATAKKTTAKKTTAKKVSKTVKSTMAADLKKSAGTPAEGLDAKPASVRSFEQVVARSASGALGSGRSRDQKIRLEGHDPRAVQVAVAKLQAAKNM